MGKELAKRAEAELAFPGLDRAAAYAQQARSASTRRNYARAWRQFQEWAEGRATAALPADPRTLAAYVAELADQGRSPASIGVALAAIRDAHELAGHPTPTAHPGVREVVKGVRRALGTAPKALRAPLVVDQLKAVLAELPAGLLGVRDAGLLLVGWAGALRRSELVGLDAEDLRYVEQGVELRVRRAKGDQEGRGRVVRVPYAEDASRCPVRALRHWLDAASIRSGPVFRGVDRHENVRPGRLSAGMVGRVLKRYAAAAGIDERDLGAHSLRSGAATSAAQSGAEITALRDHLRHASIETTAVYVRQREAWERHPMKGLL